MINCFAQGLAKFYAGPFSYRQKRGFSGRKKPGACNCTRLIKDSVKNPLLRAGLNYFLTDK
ncbi:MAG: hypothetical protein EGQ14_06730 [Spirochaetia bacterium]|nr:hypothetical protein [Spirochaetia bacterium]